MKKTNRGLMIAVLAASTALATSSTAATAAPPTATQLPGKGDFVVGTPTVTVDTTTNTMTVTLGGTTVIDWNKGTDANPTGVAGFNVGSDAAVNFTGSFGVLNIDSTGDASQILGDVDAAGSVFIANGNGIIVGNDASIRSTAGGVGLIANTRGGGTFDGTAAPTSIEYGGTGGDITVARGAAIKGATTVLVSGGSAVNIDLGAITSGATTIQAGVTNSTSTLVDNNTSAVLAATGAIGGSATLAGFASAGAASSSGTLTLGNARVDGTLTNTGALTLGAGFAIAGALVNNKTVTQAAAASMGSLVNNGVYDGGTFDLTTTEGGIANNASITNLGSVTTSGDFVNNGVFVCIGGLDVNDGGGISNKGEATLGESVLNIVSVNEGGDFSNEGTMSLSGGLVVVNGSIANSGKLTVNQSLNTASDLTPGRGYAPGADYSITNTGTITSGSDLDLVANSGLWGDRDLSDKNDSTGSVYNTGVLGMGAGYGFLSFAWNDISLGGSMIVAKKALSDTNPLHTIRLQAGNGVLTLDTALVTNSFVFAKGAQVRVMADVTDVSAGGWIDVAGGHLDGADYDIRIAAGKTIAADNVDFQSLLVGTSPSLILQGTIAGDDIYMGTGYPLSDIFVGPNGSIQATGAAPAVTFNFAGRVKAAPYLNSSNFRYNYLPITLTDADTLDLVLNPQAWDTNGTANGLAAVNLLVNGSVHLKQSVVSAATHGNDTAIAGLTNVPNTHLVLQAAGDITVGGGGDFYWPGYVYLGTIDMDADGNPLPGTLGLGQISTGGEFNNVLPGSVASAGGIHFMTQLPLDLGGDVITNANSWVNFANDTLTNGYASGAIDTGAFGFFGGVKSATSNVVTYGELDASMFHTHPVSSAKK